MGSVKKIVVKGERCSGTNYLHSLIKKNFSSVTTSNELGWKHSYLNLANEKLFQSDEILVLIIFRNPYDWVNSLYNNPWHLNKTNGNKFIVDVSFSEFLRFNPYPENEKDFDYDMLREIKFKELHPFKLQYPKNVLELRNWKNDNFLRHQNIFKNISFVNYESLYENPKLFLDNLSERFLSESYNFVNVEFYKGHEGEGLFKKKKYPKMLDEDFDFFIENLDWSIEEKIGYTKTEIENFHKYS